MATDELRVVALALDRQVADMAADQKRMVMEQHRMAMEQQRLAEKQQRLAEEQRASADKLIHMQGTLHRILDGRRQPAQADGGDPIEGGLKRPGEETGGGDFTKKLKREESIGAADVGIGEKSAEKEEECIILGSTKFQDSVQMRRFFSNFIKLMPLDKDISWSDYMMIKDLFQKGDRDWMEKVRYDISTIQIREHPKCTSKRSFVAVTRGYPKREVAFCFMKCIDKISPLPKECRDAHGCLCECEHLENQCLDGSQSQGNIGS